MGNTTQENFRHGVKSVLRRVFLLINTIMTKWRWHKEATSYPNEIQKEQTSQMISE